MGRYAFFFDSRSCSGCKACQIACKDRHGLEVGRLWRRVYEVSGGSWQRLGEAWLPQVYAYNLSVACNHCERAVCAEVCPARAIYQREDGIVLIEAERCLGCRYCSWACPYGAPQYDFQARTMTKCTFCVEDVEAGLTPACVAACPLRALDFGESVDLEHRQGVRAVTPLPAAEITRPALFVQPHPDAVQAKQAGKIANVEEVRTGKKISELPLVTFTVLAQMAVGAFIGLGAWSGWASQNGAGMDRVRDLTLKPLLASGIIFVTAVLVSLFHLGRPLRAYRALSNLRSSWLSREIFSAGLFGAGWAIFCGLLAILSAFTSVLWVSLGLATLAGLALIFSMARVYRLDSLTGWNNWRTPVSFFLTAALLGGLFSAALLTPRIQAWSVLQDVFFGWLGKLTSSGAALGMLLLAFDLALQGRCEDKRGKDFWLEQLRLALNVAAMLSLAVILASNDGSGSPGLFLLAFCLTLGAQLIGRWQFYERLNERAL